MADFCYETGTTDLTTCSKYDLALANWKPKRDPLKAHMRQSPNCPLAQALSEKQKSAATVTPASSASSLPIPVTKASISCPSASSGLAPSAPSIRSQTPSLQPLSSLNCSSSLQAPNGSGSSASQSTSYSKSVKSCSEIHTQSQASLAASSFAKSETCANDIGFFDPTMQLNLPEFHLFSTSVDFIQNLDITAQYKETNVLAALAKYLRGPTYKWLKEQPDFESLASFKTTLAATFPPQEAPTSPSLETAPYPSPQYHSCPECNAQFSSISRLLAHTQKDCFKLACKHCEKSFNSNNKLHEHMRLRHSQKAPIASSSTHSIPAAPSAAPHTTSLDPPAPPTTPRKYIIETLRHRLEEKGGKHVNLPFTFFASSSPPRASLRASQRAILLSRTLESSIFAASLSPSLSFSPTTSLQYEPISHVIKRSSKLYMTIDNLSARFAGKQQEPSPCDIQVCAPSSPFRQAHITSYFKPVISSAN